MSPEFARLVTFEGHEDILRASPLNTVMRHAGAIYKNADGSAETYKLSEPVSVIDTFVSHNWSVSRYKKFVALALHFNFYIAAAVTTLYCIVLMILGYFNVIPCVITYQGETIAIVGSVTCAPVFLITFYCCRDVLWACGMPTRAVFLDKTCIHQTDKGLQQVGIQKLGAFLHRSRHMLVLHSNVYWVKLWTVYEIAAFLSLHRVERMTVLPVQQAVFFALCVPLCTVWQYSATVLWFLGFGLGAYFCLGIILAFVHIVVHRLWARERQASFNTVSNFTVQNCQCCCEADRPVVYDNIRTLMIGCGVVSADSEEDVALAAFDELVRSRMIHRVVAGIGYWSFEYRVYVVIGFMNAGCFAIDEVQTVSYGRPMRAGAVNMVYYAAWTFVYWPLLCLLAELVAKTKLHLQGWREKVWVLVIVFSGVVAPVAVLLFGLSGIRYAAWSHDGALAMTALLPIPGSILLFAAFRFGRTRLVAARGDSICHRAGDLEGGGHDWDASDGDEGVEGRGAKDAGDGREREEGRRARDAPDENVLGAGDLCRTQV